MAYVAIQRANRPQECYRITDSKGYRKLHYCPFKEALKKAKSLAKIHGDNTLLYVRYLSKNKKDESYVLIGNRFHDKNSFVNFPMSVGLAKIPNYAIDSAKGRGKGYFIFIYKSHAGVYYIRDSEDYDKRFTGRYEDAFKVARGLVNKHGQGASIIISGCSPKKDGCYMLVEKKMVKYSFP